jgi:mono/diheme cytochrome c family protein
MTTSIHHGHDHGPDDDDRPETKLYGVLAEFDSPGALIEGAKRVRAAGYRCWDAHSPFPVHGIDNAMGIRQTILPILVFGGGMTGTALAFLMQWWMNAVDYPWIVSGKPYDSVPQQIPIAFEVTILLSVLTAFFGMWALNKLPQVWHPLFGKDRFLKATDDGFFIAIEAADPRFDGEATSRLLREAGATAVETSEYVTSKTHRQIPRALMGFVLLTSVLALVPFAFVAKARASKSEKPHFHVIPDMDFQEYRGSQAASPAFPDGRTERGQIAGTVARGDLREDDHFYRGLVDGPSGPKQWAESFPPQITLDEKAMKRGEDRFTIYCTPCHGQVGEGDGMIHKRALATGALATGWVQPSRLGDEGFVRQPHGQIFNTISHGIRTMPAYRTQISEEDRWNIVLYVRALQRSQNATIDDVPADKRQSIR